MGRGAYQVRLPPSTRTSSEAWAVFRERKYDNNRRVNKGEKLVSPWLSGVALWSSVIAARVAERSLRYPRIKEGGSFDAAPGPV